MRRYKRTQLRRHYRQCWCSRCQQPADSESNTRTDMIKLGVFFFLVSRPILIWNKLIEFIFHLQAYKRETSSVRIAKIIGVTVVASSLILGAFILASTYLQARASCDQMQTLDSILEKELMLETLQQVSSLILGFFFGLIFRSSRIPARSN